MPRAAAATGKAGTVGIFLWRLLLPVVLTGVVLAGPAWTPTVARAAAATTAAEANPPEIQLLLNLLGDPKVRDWLKQHDAKPAAAAAGLADQSVSQIFDTRLVGIRTHLAALAEAVPELPAQFWQAHLRVNEGLGENGRTKALLLLALFTGLGATVEWLFRRALRGVEARLEALPHDTVKDRLRLIAFRFALAFGVVTAFAVGSIGPFLARDWPPLLREMLFGYLMAFLVARVAGVVSHFLLAPRDERLRIIPMDDAAARFWHRRVVAFVGWFAFGWVTVGLGVTLGYPLEVRQLTAYVLGLGLLGIAIEAVWRRPAAPPEPGAHQLGAPQPGAPQPGAQGFHRLGHGAANTALSVGIVMLWASWVIHATGTAWLIFVVLILPLAIMVSRRAVENMLTAPGSVHRTEGDLSIRTVCIERGIRAGLIIGAAGLLAWGWGLDVGHLRGEDSWIGRAANCILSVVVILLVADFLWYVAKTAIDRTLAEAAEPGIPNSDDARRRARLRTLLPILRNILLVVVIVITAMMTLGALGVEIGPLIAGAGVVGVAIGFGAQSFVRDVIAGMFYLMDDAFRVGEYIQAGNYKGTIEGFSIRSVKLRHHRGPVYTVPFSLLGAVQNQSRDWVIDKTMIGITYDSDIEKARKLIKKIGLELKEIPEFAPLILEPLKMQGVESFGDFAVQIRMKMMTVPGEQFVIRRKAFAMIKQAFDENGIKFAFPTVKVAGDGADSVADAAVAQSGLELARPAAAA